MRPFVATGSTPAKSSCFARCIARMPVRVASLAGDTCEEALLFVHGIGGSGKSTAINTIAALMGDYSVAVDTETITAQKHARHSTEIARLHGARMAYASETEAGRAWAENRIKQLTGGDTMTARFMRQDDFEFKPQLKLVVVGNNKPAFANVDGAIKRRFNVMPFDQKPIAPDHGLKDALRAEFPGILSWAVQGCLDWQRNGLVRPEIMRETTAEYFDETIPSPADVSSGDVVIVGNLVGIASGAAASGADLDLTLEGVFMLDKVAANAVTVGAPIFWNGTLATTTSTDNTRIGTAVAPAAASTATVTVRLSGF